MLLGDWLFREVEGVVVAEVMTECFQAVNVTAGTIIVIAFTVAVAVAENSHFLGSEANPTEGSRLEFERRDGREVLKHDGPAMVSSRGRA